MMNTHLTITKAANGYIVQLPVPEFGGFDPNTFTDMMKGLKKTLKDDDDILAKIREENEEKELKEIIPIDISVFVFKTFNEVLQFLNSKLSGA